MTFTGKKRSRPAALQLTAMMDVIFLLLCFFVTSSVFSQWESEICISLPAAESATVPGRMPGELIINVDKDGMVTVNGQPWTLGELGRRLKRVAKLYPGQAVVIRADKDAHYEKLVNVIDACRQSGIWNFSLASTSSQHSSTNIALGTSMNVCLPAFIAQTETGTCAFHDVAL